MIRARPWLERDTGLVWVFVAVLVLARQPHALLRPQFIWEEAAAFWAATFTLDPFSYLIEAWGGYVVLVPRAAFLLARLGPPELAPAVTITIHACIIGAVAAFLASNRMKVAIPDDRVRFAFGVSMGLLPFAEPYLSVLSGQWFLAILLSGMSLSPPRRWDYPVIVLAGLSGIATVLTLPLFWRDRRSVVLFFCAAVQVGVVVSSERVLRNIHIELVAVILAVVVLLALKGARGLPKRTVLTFGYLAVVTLGAATIAFGAGGRYALAAAAVLVLIAIAGTVERHPVGIALAAMSAAMIVAGLPLPKVGDTRWGEHARCIGGRTRCVVPVEPEAWSVDWDPGHYVVPRLGPDAQPIP